MNDISLETVTGKLNRLGYDAFMQALRHAKNAGNRNLELAHWFYHIIGTEKSDIALTLDHYGIDRAKVLTELGAAVAGLRKNETEMPGISSQINDVLDRGWYYATLMFGESQIRTGHLLLAILNGIELKQAIRQVSATLASISPDALATDANTIWAASDEETLRPMDGKGLAAGPSAGDGAAPGGRGTTPLARFSTDMTEAAASGKIDPVVGRDDEIRQVIDVLLRRRQNNPILTGEAGVGKTAVAEGFALRLASGDVPPQLKGVRLHALDIGLMQAGASMKGEFEQRLRSVID
ncbi:MAG TPA: Clp protease N-terminal domain-containing protein, partial [Devosia sp.]|nr:Clp protease N-terminal domain-containing protein [Devosia sp.]